MAGEFDFFTDEPPARPPTGVRGRAPDDHPGSAPGPGPRKVSGLAIGTIFLGGVLVIAGGVVGVVLAVGGSRTTGSKDTGGGPTAVPTRPAVTAKKDPAADLATPSPDVVERVKKATVRILVQVPRKKGIASGSGFVEKDSRLVLTNAHVVGMKTMTDPQPLINLIVNSGARDGEYRLDGEVVALDAENDLAVIRPALLEVGKPTPVPEGLVIPKHAAVAELQKLFVFGFPLVDVLGSEISIRPTQVTSLRHEGGRLKRIQVEGGMTFGNSGGPVVDVRGNVVGVAVSGIKDANINFCVPGEMVQQLLAGRNEWKD